jgi:hypothetical protein
MNVWIKRAALLLLLAVAAWLTSLLTRSPEQQLRDAQEQLIANLQSRSWFSVANQMSDTYLDDWGQDSSTAHNAMRHVLGGFKALEIGQEFVAFEHAPASKSSPALGFVRVHLRVNGDGGPLADMVIAESLRLKEPWFFHWRKEGAWPWSWKLTQVHHDEVSVPSF